MRDSSAAVEPVLREIATRHDIDLDAVEVLFRAMVAGGGIQAQFNHPALGGMGQWSQGGMIMIGDMFNTDLKARISAICTALSELVGAMPPGGSPAAHQGQTQGAGQGASLHASDAFRPWWPEQLGQAGSTGAQNSLRYAFFPLSRRLAVDTAGQIAVYDTGEHRITGFSQQQGGDQSITFTSQHGPVRIAELARLFSRAARQTWPHPNTSRRPRLHRLRMSPDHSRSRSRRLRQAIPIFLTRSNGSPACMPGAC